MSVYQLAVATIAELIPDTWKFTEYEPNAPDLPEVTGVTLKVRAVTRLPQAPIGAWQIDCILSVTSGLTSRESADPQLADDLFDFLLALDEAPSASWLAWVRADKVAGDDNDRLAYDINITLTTQKTKEA